MLHLHVIILNLNIWYHINIDMKMLWLTACSTCILSLSNASTPLQYAEGECSSQHFYWLSLTSVLHTSNYIIWYLTILEISIINYFRAQHSYLPKICCSARVIFRHELYKKYSIVSATAHATWPGWHVLYLKSFDAIIYFPSPLLSISLPKSITLLSRFRIFRAGPRGPRSHTAEL